ncbi:hypothetical protein ACIA5D_37125 [Actinoplanes sp. NPDC051513]
METGGLLRAHAVELVTGMDLHVELHLKGRLSDEQVREAAAGNDVSA